MDPKQVSFPVVAGVAIGSLCTGAVAGYLWSRRSLYHGMPVVETRVEDMPSFLLEPEKAVEMKTSRKQSFDEGIALATGSVQAEAKLYHSGQSSLFTKEVLDMTIATPHVIKEVHTFRVANLRDFVPNLKRYENKFFRTRQGMKGLPGYRNSVSHDQLVLVDIIRKPEGTSAIGMNRSGPRDYTVFHPKDTKAAIVTCGGLCPGLNDVIYELVHICYYNYGIDTIYGIKAGFRGFYEEQYMPYLELNPDSVEGIHKRGGSILGSSRGGFDAEKIIKACVEHGINQVYVVGGDGTHRAAAKLFELAQSQKLKLVVAGIPKTIDNDIGVIDRSFGFDTAVEEAVRAIDSARIEAECVPNGIGIVKLMGRHAGFISTHATMADRNVDLCLIPEISMSLDGPRGIYQHVEEALKSQGNCVIVVAEGACVDVMECNSNETDESGNQRLPPVGEFLKSSINSHFAAKGIQVNIKYNDPSYMIRSVPSNAADSVYSMILAQNAVHGAMAGYTGFTSALVNSRTCMIPMEVIVKTSPTHLNPSGRTWERVTRVTHQHSE